MQVFILPIKRLVILDGYKEVVSFPILVRVIEYTLCLFSISSTPAAFLNITLQTFRNRVMNYKSDIWFINTQSKCNGSYYNLYFIVHPFPLDLMPSQMRYFCMVIITFYLVISLKGVWQCFTILAWYAVDDTTLTCKPVPKRLWYIIVYVL